MARSSYGQNLSLNNTLPYNPIVQLLYNFLQVLCEMEEHRIPLISRHLLAHGEELFFLLYGLRQSLGKTA